MNKTQKIESAQERIRAINQRLRIITRGCRPDMHEPDEQGVSAVVFGTHLDNAMGTEIDPNALCNGHHEIVVVIRNQDDETESFMLADLIAMARR